MASSQTSQRLHVVFDDHRQIADAGLLLPATLAKELGLQKLIEEHVDLGERQGRANVGAKAMLLVASLLAGGDCIDDAAALRSPGTEAILGHRVLAPSTLGTFLRSFTYGHSRQLEPVMEAVLARAWAMGAGPGEQVLTIDVDSTICETYGEHKQGAARTYANIKGYQPLLATTLNGEVLHARLRGGAAAANRGAGSFLVETLGRVRRAGARGGLLVRADSGFYSRSVALACRQHDARFSITARRQSRVVAAYSAIPDSEWRAIPWTGATAEVAEVGFQAFGRTSRGEGRPIPVRLIVRRVLENSGAQLPLPGVGYHYHAFITDRPGDLVELEADHRRHAQIENQIRELKHDLALNHLPSGRFAANAVWLALNVIAHNLALWVAKLGLGDRRLTVKTLRRRLFSIPGRLVRSGRRLLLRLPARWPWQAEFALALSRLGRRRHPLLT